MKNETVTIEVKTPDFSNVNIADSDWSDYNREYFKAMGYKFITTLIGYNTTARTYTAKDMPHKTFTDAIDDIIWATDCKTGTNHAWAIKDIDGRILYSGNDFADFADFLDDLDDKADDQPLELDHLNDVDDDELVDPPEVVTVETNEREAVIEKLATLQVELNSVNADIKAAAKHHTPMRDLVIRRRNILAELETLKAKYTELTADKPATVEVPTPDFTATITEPVTLDEKLAALYEASEQARKNTGGKLEGEGYNNFRAAVKAVDEFIYYAAIWLNEHAPDGYFVMESWAEVDAPKFVICEQATDKRTSYYTIAETEAALKTLTKDIDDEPDTPAPDLTQALLAVNRVEFNNKDLWFDSAGNSITANAAAKILEPYGLTIEGYIAAENPPADKIKTLAKNVAETMTAAAPDGWTITATADDNFTVEYNNKLVTSVDTITAGDYLNPTEFFEQFKPEPKYPIDFLVYHGNSMLTDAEIKYYCDELEKAITANGNFGFVELDASDISVQGNTGGDNKTLWKLIGDLCWRGECRLEYINEDGEQCEMPGTEIDSMFKRMGIDNAPPASESPVARYLNEHAPKGWSVKAINGRLNVKFNGKHVADVDRVVTRDLLDPHAFFNQMRTLADKDVTPIELFIEERKRELNGLFNMRKECVTTRGISAATINTIDDMIEHVKRDILEAEFCLDEEIWF